MATGLHSLGLLSVSPIVLSHCLHCILFLLLPLSYELLRFSLWASVLFYAHLNGLIITGNNSTFRSWAHVLTWDPSFQVQRLHEPFSLGCPGSSHALSHYLPAQSSSHSLTQCPPPSEATHSFQAFSPQILDKSQICIYALCMHPQQLPYCWAHWNSIVHACWVKLDLGKGAQGGGHITSSYQRLKIPKWALKMFWEKQSEAVADVVMADIVNSNLHWSNSTSY